MELKEVGARLRDLRGEESTQSLAKKLGITPQAIWMYENGERMPRDEVKIAYSEYFHVPIGQLFYGE